MRTTFAAVAAGLMLAGTAQAADLYYGGPAPAGDPIYAPHSLVTGDVQLAAGFEEDDLRSYGGGRVNFALASGWDLLVEAMGSTFAGGSFAGYGHLYYDHPSFSFGVFGGAGASSSGFYTLGVEAETAIGYGTKVGGRLGYIKPDLASGITMGNLWLDYYFNAATRLKVQGAWYTTSGSDGWGLSGQLAHQFNGSPVVGTLELGVRDYASNSNVYGLVGAQVMFDDPGTSLAQHDDNVRYQIGYPLNYGF